MEGLPNHSVRLLITAGFVARLMMFDQHKVKFYRLNADFSSDLENPASNITSPKYKIEATKMAAKLIHIRIKNCPSMKWLVN